jgi:hypothetical protein
VKQALQFFKLEFHDSKEIIHNSDFKRLVEVAESFSLAFEVTRPPTDNENIIKTLKRVKENI